jgi:multidrug efflux pump subunit AcrB
VPAQDKQYLIGFAQLPDAASLDRTDAVIRKMSDIAKEIPAWRTRSRSRPVDQRLHQRAERRHRVHWPETVRPAHQA